jgi:ribosomal protein L25 (general stress protein Ctc)
MSDVDAPVKLQQRQILGKGLGGLRLAGDVPAVIHNHGQESIHVMGPEVELLKIYRAAGKHHPLNLEVGDSKFLGFN